MKTFNTKLIVALITTLVLTGCMPDSLTKFKKDAPKKAASTAADEDTSPPITDGSGNAVDPSTLVFPTKFYFGTEGVTAEDAFKVNTAVNMVPQTDGTLADPTKRSIIFLKCELDDSGAVITRTLPPGLTLNSSTCAITGTPTTIYSDTTSGNVGGKITYTVRMAYKGASYTGVGTESSLLAVIKFAVYDTPIGLSMTQNDKLQMKLTPRSGLISNIQTNTDSSLAYNRYGILNTNSGTTGIVKYVDSTSGTVGVYKLQPIVVASATLFSAGNIISTASGKRGKIVSKNGTTLYIEALSPNTVFAVGDALDNQAPHLITKTTISSVNTSYKFTSGDKTDNDSQYFTEKFAVDTITQTYERGVTIPPISPILTPTLQPANGIEWGISPALPAGLSFDTATGIISGSFTDTLDSTEFTIGAYNDIGEILYKVRLAAINSPKDLSYTSNQLISVNSNALFLEGESLFQPIAPPLNIGVSGRINRLVSTNKMAIETLNGAFLSEASLDSGNAYYSEKNYVTVSSDPNYYNIVLSVSATTATNFPVGNYITSSTGAKGRVVYVDSTNDILYVQFLTPTIVSSIPGSPVIATFAEGTTLDNVYPFVSPKTTIVQVEAANMALKVTNTVGFDPGTDITSDSSHSGYVYAWDTTNDILKVNEINRTNAVGGNYFRIGQNLDPSEYYGSAVSQINGVTHDNLIVIERGLPRVIKANVSQGTSVNYSISPTLPAGLTLNTTDGTISGTATMRSVRKSYVVTATNLLDKAYYAFDLEVRDYFSFAESTGAKSFLTHKIGTNRTHRACRINSADILSGNSQALDIGCNLEAEELELFYTKLKMSASVGAGTCEYIGFRPFSFWQYAPEKTDPTTRIINYANSCSGGTAVGATTTAPTAANSCYGNYTDDNGPNCDTGSVTVRTHTASTGTTCDTISTQILSCGGVKTACLAGPVTSVMTESELKSDFRMKTVTASAGAVGKWEIKSSVDFLDVTNLRTANNVVRNKCTDTRADANAWSDLVEYLPSVQHPFGGGESPFYEFTCLDAAQDVKARIRLNVRDWNRTFRINDSLTALLPPKMNVRTAQAFGPSYNNTYDWDDYYYDDTKPATAGPANMAGACGLIAGSCADGTAKTLPVCKAAGFKWIAGSCSDTAYKSPTICTKNGEVWTTEGYPFPKDNI